MAQTTFDDEYIDEATSEIRDNVEASLDNVHKELPDPDAVWDVEADNTLGVLNTLRTALAAGDAADHLRDAKKWYTMGEQAGEFGDDDGLAADIVAAEELLADLEAASDQAGDLASTVPQLKDALEGEGQDQTNS